MVRVVLPATDLHAALDLDVMGNAAELHGKLNSKFAFSLPDFEGHGGDVNIHGGSWQHCFLVLLVRR